MVLLKNGHSDVNTDDASTRLEYLAEAEADLVRMLDTVSAKADISDYTDLPEGQSLIHQAWAGDMVAAQWYFPKGTEDKDVLRYWTPKQGEAVGNDLITALAGGNNPVLAHLFMNFMLDYEMSMVNFQWNGYLPPQSAVDPESLIRGSGAPYSVVQPSLISTLVTEADFGKGVQLLELSPEVDARWKDVWEVFGTA